MLWTLSASGAFAQEMLPTDPALIVEPVVVESVNLTDAQYAAYDAALDEIDYFSSPDETERHAIIDAIVADAAYVGLDVNDVADVVGYVQHLSGFALPAVGSSELLGTVECSDFYDFGSVAIQLGMNAGEVLSGTPVFFSGSVTNNNPYPIVDGALYVKVFRLDEDEATLGVNGPSVIDQGFVVEDITLGPGETKSVDFVWEVPAFTISGEYMLATFFTTSHKFNLAGLSFTDDMVGTDIHFSIIGEQEAGVTFDKNNVTLNDLPHAFANFPLRFLATEPVTIAAPVINTTNEEQVIPIEWRVYQWDAQRQEQQVAFASETIVVPAGGTVPATYSVIDTSHPVYLVEGKVKYEDTQSIINVRFVRDGIARARLNFPSIMSYPLYAGEATEVFSCFHGMSDPTIEGAELSLSLLDTHGTPFYEQTYTGAVVSDVHAVSESFVPETTITDFDLVATLKQGDMIVDDVTVAYRCDDIDPEMCVKEVEAPPEAEPSLFSRLGYWVYLIALGVVLLVVGAWFLIFMHANPKRSEKDEWIDPE